MDEDLTAQRRGRGGAIVPPVANGQIGAATGLEAGCPRCLGHGSTVAGNPRRGGAVTGARRAPEAGPSDFALGAELEVMAGPIRRLRQPRGHRQPHVGRAGLPGEQVGPDEELRPGQLRVHPASAGGRHSRVQSACRCRWSLAASPRARPWRHRRDRSWPAAGRAGRAPEEIDGPRPRQPVRAWAALRRKLASRRRSAL